MSQEEVVRLIEAALNLWRRTILMLLYSTGLRRAEAIHLKMATSTILVRINPVLDTLRFALDPLGRARHYNIGQMVLFQNAQQLIIEETGIGFVRRQLLFRSPIRLLRPVPQHTARLAEVLRLIGAVLCATRSEMIGYAPGSA